MPQLGTCARTTRALAIQVATQLSQRVEHGSVQISLVNREWQHHAHCRASNQAGGGATRGHAPREIELQLGLDRVQRMGPLPPGSVAAKLEQCLEPGSGDPTGDRGGVLALDVYARPRRLLGRLLGV